MKKKELVPLLDEFHGADDPSYAQAEYEIDLAKIYLRVKEWLLWEERAVFCHILAGHTPEEISELLHIDLPIVVKLKETLIRKLQYAATTTQADAILFRAGSDSGGKEKKPAARDLH